MNKIYTYLKITLIFFMLQANQCEQLKADSFLIKKIELFKYKTVLPILATLLITASAGYSLGKKNKITLLNKVNKSETPLEELNKNHNKQASLLPVFFGIAFLMPPLFCIKYSENNTAPIWSLLCSMLSLTCFGYYFGNIIDITKDDIQDENLLLEVEKDFVDSNNSQLNVSIIKKGDLGGDFCEEEEAHEELKPFFPNLNTGEEQQREYVYVYPKLDQNQKTVLVESSPPNPNQMEDDQYEENNEELMLEKDNYFSTTHNYTYTRSIPPSDITATELKDSFPNLDTSEKKQREYEYSEEHQEDKNRFYFSKEDKKREELMLKKDNPWQTTHPYTNRGSTHRSSTYGSLEKTFNNYHRDDLKQTYTNNHKEQQNREDDYSN